MSRFTLLTSLMGLALALTMASATAASAGSGPTVYILSKGKILSFDVGKALKASKVAVKKAKVADKKFRAEAKKAKAQGRTVEDARLAKKKKKPADNAKVISEGWADAVSIDAAGEWMYVLTKDSVKRFKIAGDGTKTTLASGLTDAQQMVVDGGWVYLRGGSSVSRFKADGDGKPVQITKGWGGMHDITVHKGAVTIRMNDGKFFALRGAKWKDKLVSKGWSGLRGMKNDGVWVYLFSGGQVFRFKPGQRGTEVMGGLDGGLRNMWVHKGNLYFSAQGGRVFTAKAKRGAQVFKLRSKTSFIDDMDVQ